MERRGLRVLRAKEGLTQAQMAERLGMSRSTYGLVEGGKAPASMRFVKALASGFGMAEAEAFGIVEGGTENG